MHEYLKKKPLTPGNQVTPPVSWYNRHRTIKINQSKTVGVGWLICCPYSYRRIYIAASNPQCPSPAVGSASTL